MLLTCLNLEINSVELYFLAGPMGPSLYVRLVTNSHTHSLTYSLQQKKVNLGNSTYVFLNYTLKLLELLLYNFFYF